MIDLADREDTIDSTTCSQMSGDLKCGIYLLVEVINSGNFSQYEVLRGVASSSVDLSIDGSDIKLWRASPSDIARCWKSSDWCCENANREWGLKKYFFTEHLDYKLLFGRNRSLQTSDITGGASSYRDLDRRGLHEEGLIVPSSSSLQ